MEQTSVTVTAYPDGPLIVRGPVEILGEDGMPIARPRRATALCRCGRTTRPPLCDGTHQAVPRTRGVSGTGGRS